MKKILSIALLAIMFTGVMAQGKKAPEDKNKRPSPPAKVTQVLESGANVSFDYSQPAVKGRTIGKDLEPMEGKVWRTGANEATIFETDKDISVEGKSLSAGKYGFFTIYNGGECTLIFNKTWSQWGAFKYAEADDVLRVKVPVGKQETMTEKFTITVDKAGKVSLFWGDTQVNFNIK